MEDDKGKKEQERARAEARTRRILANAENRLKKIGVTQDKINTIPGLEDGAIPKGTEYKDDEFPHLQTPRAAYSGSANAYDRDSPDDASAFDHQRFSLGRDEMIFNNFSQMFQTMGGGPGQQAPQPTGPANPILESRCHISVLAVIMYFFTILFPHLVGGYLFVPLFVLELSEVFLAKPQQQSSMLGTLLVFSGITPGNAEILLKILHMVGNYLKDACIYVFTIVVIHGICSVVIK